MGLGGGYAGKMIEADLTKGAVTVSPLREDLALKYIGGRGFTSRLQWELVGPAVDPLGPDNVSIVATGPLTGTQAAASGRFTVGGRSPLTGILGDANSGGMWAAELKLAGYDLIILKGAAREPVYLVIDDERVELRDARHLWGRDTWETGDVIVNDLGEGFRVACIGPAGENLVRVAGIVVDADHLAARTGVGAVWGSKKLKAIAVRGTRDITIARPREFVRLADELWNLILCDKMSGTQLPKYGTTSLLNLHNDLGGLVTRNAQGGYFERADRIDCHALHSSYFVLATACYNCPCRCDRYSVVKEGEFAGTRVGGPEYFTIASFGSRCDNDNLASIIKANELCNRWGLDTASTGALIGFAMECYERGLLSRQRLGYELNWGNYRAILSLVGDIAFRRGFGNVLADGVRAAVAALGPASARYAIHVKGMEPAPLDPRALKVYNFRYAVASRGADHLRISAHGAYELDRYPAEEAARRLKFWQDVVCVPDLMGICKFPYTFYSETPEVTFRKALELVPSLYEAATGVPLDRERLLQVSDRVAQTERAFNVRLGVGPKDDCLPARFLEEPLPAGPKKGEVYDRFDEVKRGFYLASGWDEETGAPRRERLEELGLQDVIEDLSRLGKLPG